MKLNVQMVTPRLREACIPVQDNTVFGPESELEPRSLVTLGSAGFLGCMELSLVLTQDPPRLGFLH